MADHRRLPYLRNRIQEQPETKPNDDASLQQPQPLSQQPFQPAQHPPHPTSAQQPLPSPQPQNIASNTANKKASRIDTELIPRPIVQAEKSILYENFKTTPAPLYHTPQASQYFIVEDDGNTSPRYMRCSTYAIGNDSAITQSTELPYGCVVQPLADPGVYEEQVPQVEFEGEPIRCQRCKAYVNPFFTFTDNGNSFICNLCKMKNPVKNEYFSPLGQNNQRSDKYNRYELHRGCYEIVAPADYVKKPIANILTLFCIELTPHSVAKGVFLQVLSSLQAIIESMPCPERNEIAIVTYDQRMHFYNLPENLASEPQLVIVSEMNEVNIPLPKEKLFLNVEKDKEKISYLLEKLMKQAEIVASGKASQYVPLGTVINNAAHLMAPRSGRVLVFGSHYANIGMGALKQRRNDTRVFGTAQEKELYQPQDQTYVNIGKFCVQNHIAVDLWVFNDEWFDLATVAPVSNMTGGSIYYYPQYDPVVNGSELHYALFRNLTRSYAYDCIMTLRLSNGLVLHDYYTSQGKQSVRDLELSTIDSDKTIGIVFKHEDRITDSEAYLQYALLYTNVYGQRVIRVMNMSLQVVSKMAGNNPYHNIFKTADMDAVMNLLIRKHIPNILTQANKDVRTKLIDNLVAILHSYRKYCSSSSPPGQLILPEAIKTVPIFIQALLKRDILKTGVVRVDSRIYELHVLLSASFNFLTNYLYPKCYPVHDLSEKVYQEQFQGGQYLEEQKVVMPSNVACSIEKFKHDGIYVVDTSAMIYIYVTRQAPEALLSSVRQLFQVGSIDQMLQVDSLANVEEDEYNQRVNNIIDQIRRNKNGAYQAVKVVVQKQPIPTYLTRQHPAVPHPAPVAHRGRDAIREVLRRLPLRPPLLHPGQRYLMPFKILLIIHSLLNFISKMFHYPALFSELKVHGKNPLAGLDERMKMIKLSNFDDAFKVDMGIIDEYSELVFHAINDLSKNYSQEVHIQVLQILTFQVNQLLKSGREEQLQKTTFFLLNALSVAPQKQQDLAKTRQQLSQGQIQMYKKALRLVQFVLESKILPREASRYVFDFIQLFLDVRDSECRDLLVKILLEAVLCWQDNLQYLKTKITNLIYESDTVVVPLANFFHEVYARHDSFVLETLTLLMNYVNQQHSESNAVRNLKDLLAQTAKRNPHMFYLNLPTFLHLYDSDNYHLRNALTEVLGSVVEHLVKQRDENDNYDKARDRLIDTLLLRQHDKVAFARSQVLQCFNNLLAKNCISDLKPVLQMAVERVRDVSGWVRKGAVQLLKQICKYYHYIYVESQGRSKFYTSQEVDQIMEANREEIEDMKKLFEEGNAADIEDLRANAERVTKQQAQMEEYQHFLKMIKRASHLIAQLLGSKNQTDVIAAIKYFTYLKKHELEGYTNGLKKMMILIWGNDKQIIQEVVKKFWKLFIRPKDISVLMKLMETSSVKEVVCIEKFIQYYLTKSEDYKIKSSMIEQLWVDLDDLKIVLLRIIYTSQPSLLSEERQKQLLQIMEDYKREAVNFNFVKEICTIIEKVNPKELQRFVSIGSLLLYKYFGTDRSWYKGCEAVISLLSTTSCPELYYEYLMKKLTLKMNVKTDEIEVEEVNQRKLCQLIFCLGHISLKMLVHIDNLHTQVRNERLMFEKQLDKDSQELDKIAGGIEAEQERIHELINKITEEQILQNNLISKYMPIIMLVIGNLNEIFIEQEDEYKNSELEQICVLTLCKFMCVSEQFCRDHLKLLFVIMKSKNVDQTIKNNIIISIGDLLHRFPNTVELFHKEIFSNLYDPSFAVRKITLLVLTHLVLNDMIKSRSSLAHIPKLLVDEEPQIPPMVRYFLQELQKKDPRSITNMLPEIIQNAGTHGEQILPQIVSTIDKSQVDGLLQKLITVLEKSKDQDECRNIAIVFNLVPMQLSSLKILLDGWESYRAKCEDADIQEQLKGMLKKIRNPSQEMKQLMEEFEMKLDNYQQETFDGRRKQQQQRRTKQAKKAEKNAMEIEETKEQGVRPQRKKKKTIIESEDEWEE